MKRHRSTQARVPKNAELDNFSPANALESLYADMIQVDAFAHAASEAIVQLAFPTDVAERRTFARIHTLVTKAAAEARTALIHGDELVSELSSHMEARRARRDTDPPASQA